MSLRSIRSGNVFCPVKEYVVAHVFDAKEWEEKMMCPFEKIEMSRCPIYLEYY